MAYLPSSHTTVRTIRYTAVRVRFLRAHIDVAVVRVPDSETTRLERMMPFERSMTPRRVGGRTGFWRRISPRRFKSTCVLTAAVCDLRERHCEELAATREVLAAAVALVFFYATPESLARQEIHELGENDSTIVHRQPPTEKRL